MGTATAFENLGHPDLGPNLIAQDGHDTHRLHKRSPVYYANHFVSLVHSPPFKAIAKKKALKGIVKKVPPFTPKAPLLKLGSKASKKMGKGLFLFGLKPSVGHNTFWKTKLAKKLVLKSL